MAFGSLAKPDGQHLSENWKKLQQQMKFDASKQPKHSLSRDDQEPKAKRQRTTTKSTSSRLLVHKKEQKAMSSSRPNTNNARPSASLALWAEDNDIPAQDLAAAYGTSMKNVSIPHIKYTAEKINQGVSSTAAGGKYIAIDCEMVGVGPNPDKDSALARVSIVNYHGEQLYDSFVQPKEAVTDYRTAISGITPDLLKAARTFEEVQADVAKLLDGKILVGHALRNDLDALFLSHSKRDIRDTSKHPAFRLVSGGRTPSLKKLAKEVLGVDIQGGEHSSIEDARAAMLLFRREKDGFEREHMSIWGPDRKPGHLAKGNGNKLGTRKTRKRKPRR